MFYVKCRHCIASKTRKNIKLLGQMKLFYNKHMTCLCPEYDVYAIIMTSYVIVMTS